MNGRGMRVLAIGLVIALAFAVSARAQITTGSVTGSVKDTQGGVIPGATAILINEAQNTKSTPVVTNATGDFVFVNVPAGTYVLEITMPSFKTLKHTGVSVNPGTRTTIGALTLEVGGASETVDVKAEAPVIQATTGERSFTVSTEAVENLPTASRSFIALALLAPGVVGTTANASRAGGGGDTNIMMDGVSVIDTGSNRPLLQMNVESIQEVKILTSNYQAEFGRSSGLQISAVTKSGTNRFRGSVYDVQRNSNWNANSKQNKLNGSAKTVAKEKDWGYSVGGPIGKPGGHNKLFFFYSQEFEPRTAGNNLVQFRFPTAKERAGDFSETLDQNGAPYTFIRDPNVTGACTPADQTACFADNGIRGKIPASRLYQVGLNILSQYPLPNCPGPTCATWVSTSPFNFQMTRPNESILSWQPGVNINYQANEKLRVGVKYSGWTQRKQTINGNLPGFNDSLQQNPTVSSTAVTANYQLSTSMFLEGTYGHSQNELAGCALAQSNTGPSFCTAAVPMNPNSNRNNIGLGALPLLYPDANKLDPSYYATKALNGMSPAPPAWVNGDFLKPPQFTYGSRVANAPPQTPFPGYFNINSTHDVSISLTKVVGHHTLKTGYYNTHSYKAEQATDTNSFGTINFQQDSVGTNPCDTSYGFANAAMGCFSSFQQASKYIEGNYVYDNREAYAQDNWKVNGRMTLDYGLRFVHQAPQYDKLGQAANFLPNKWTSGAAPLLYVPGCTIAVAPGTACPTANRQAMNPSNGQFLGPNSTSAFATLIPGTGSATNGLFLGGQGIVDTTYTFPALGVAPRFGMAYDLTGRQRVVLRGGGGLFYDRPFGNSVISMSGNPPASKLVTVRFTNLQSLGSGGLTTQAAPSLNTIQYDAKLPSSWQWNGGIQVALPWAVSFDMEYVGQHSFNRVRTVNINAVDIGTAFLPASQDPTLVSATPGGAAYQTDLLRPLRGYGSINHRFFDAWQTYHSIQYAFNRRFQNGISFGFNDTVPLHDESLVGARLQHAADGSFRFRDDQSTAQDLLGRNNPPRHLMRANFVWDLPDLHMQTPVFRAVGLVVNDWQLSGIWVGSRSIPGANPATDSYTIGYSYSSGGGNANLTGSPDFGGRVRIVGDPASGCSSDVYRQFNTAAFQGPLNNSVGLESNNHYLKHCWINTLDLAIARNIRLGKGRNLQLRVDMFNAPNLAAITTRNTTMNLSAPGDPVTITNLPFDTTGTGANTVNGQPGGLLLNRVRPNQAGFGAVSAWQSPRSIQAQARFSF